jgi:hypothetical protein
VCSGRKDGCALDWRESISPTSAMASASDYSRAFGPNSTGFALKGHAIEGASVQTIGAPALTTAGLDLRTVVLVRRTAGPAVPAITVAAVDETMSAM